MIERYRRPTCDFATADQTDLLYTRARVIGMIFFIEVWWEHGVNPEDLGVNLAVDRSCPQFEACG